ncbi:MAG: hypothetical protein Q8P61_00205 [Candidatus Nanopelagicales bacterium]|nr:hypothetical protein [Candidatus Nanopelagicales bacterium]
MAAPVFQSCFWNDDWQAGEVEVAEQIRNGKVRVFDTLDEFALMPEFSAACDGHLPVGVCPSG